MSTAVRPFAALLVLAAAPAPVTAQIGPGAAVPQAALQRVAGPELTLSGEGAPAVLVLAFHGSPGSACSDADLLRALLARHGEAGLAVALVTPVAADAELPAPLRDLPVVADPAGRLREQWLGAFPSMHVAVVQRGRVAWIGNPEHGLGTVVARALEGRLALDREARATALRQNLVDNFDDMQGAAAREQAELLLEHCGTDGMAWGLRYLAEQGKLVDPEAAARTLATALELLAAEPRALATFADLALRGDPRNPQLAPALLPALRAAAAAHEDDLRVQLTCLRALVRTGEGREVGRRAHGVARRVASHPPAALEFADILTKDEPAAIHRDLCERALQQAEAAGADARLLTAARYCVALRCAEDRAAADRIAAPYFDKLGSRVGLNNDAWYLMTQLRTCGRFDLFALAMAERMLHEREQMDYFELDTAALAMFLAGRDREAVELQTAAIEGGGRGNREYEERLERYRAAANPAPSGR